jgi:fructose-bisphosphate aldolase class 1
MNQDTVSTARTLIADGKGILAADETPGTLTKRFDALGIRGPAGAPVEDEVAEGSHVPAIL